MKCKFIINNDILFDASDLTLCSKLNDSRCCLAGVKGRCFLLLLSSKDDDLITKKQLHFEVWEKFGFYSNDNCLLQTIYSLRKELRKIGLDDIILTSPRLGYRINPCYHIEIEEGDGGGDADQAIMIRPQEKEPPDMPQYINPPLRYKIKSLLNKPIVKIILIILLNILFLSASLNMMHSKEIYFISNHPSSLSTSVLQGLVDKMSAGQSSPVCQPDDENKNDDFDVFVCDDSLPGG